jgi:IS605 OrfB family transposase
MTQKKLGKIIRTDKWGIKPSAEILCLLQGTVDEYRRLCRFLVTIVSTHWVELANLTEDQVTPAVERLMHQTAKNPSVKYPVIDGSFHKFPSYYRRAAISFAYGQVSSFMTRYRDWQGGIRKRRDAKPPRLNPETGCYPALYKGQCYKLNGLNEVGIKVFTGSDWIWVSMPITSVRNRHLEQSNKLLSPSLIVKGGKTHLSVPFHCKPKKVKGEGRVLAVDLGINTTATIAIVDFSGTVIHREFIHPGRDIDRRDKRLKSVSVKASKTMGKGGKLHKGFCSNTYRKCRNINKQIGHIVSKQIVSLAERFQVDSIVFEQLKGWKPKGGKRKTNLRQRFHGWLKSSIHDLTLDKWREKGGKTIDVIAAYTSKLAYDGSGTVKRAKNNYALATFPSGKQYNCDLNGALNIAARGILKLLGRKNQEDMSGKSTAQSPRSWVCLCDLWNTSVPLG